MRYLMRLLTGCAVCLWVAMPAAADARLDCGKALDDPDLGIRACTEFLRTNPNDSIAYDQRGGAYHKKGQFDLAIADFNQAIRLNPRDHIPFVRRGIAYEAKGDFDRALSDYTEAVRLKPDYALAYSNRGLAHLSKRNFDLAIPDFNEAIRLNPRDHVSFSERGVAYANKGDHDRALADYNEAIRLNPQDPITYGHRGITYAIRRDYDRALADYNEAIRLNHQHIVALARRGQLYQAKGDNAAAVADYNRALAIPAKNQAQRNEQAEARRRLGMLQNAQPSPPPVTPPVPPKVAEPAAAPPPQLGRRVALVIGNATYRVGPLQNPGNDASAMADALGRLGFDKVILRLNLTSEGFRSALREFSREALGADLGMIYFAGHGTEVGGRNYLIPVDATLAKASDLELEAVTLDTVLGQLEGVRRLRLVILDACRNNIFPLAGAQRSVGRGLSRIEPEGDNTLIVYAAKHGTTADDGVGRRHSPFTEALLKRLTTPRLDVRHLFGYVRDDVMVATGRGQQPYIYGTLGGPPLFLGQ